MRVFKKILIGLGAIFLLLIGFAAYVGFRSVQFKHEQAPFIRAYVTDLSRHWNINDVYGRNSTALNTQADSPEGQRALRRDKRLGTLISIHDFALENYIGGAGGQRGVFSFKAKFQNGEAVVQVIVVDKGRIGARVLGMHVTDVHLNPGATGHLRT